MCSERRARQILSNRRTSCLRDVCSRHAFLVTKSLTDQSIEDIRSTDAIPISDTNLYPALHVMMTTDLALTRNESAGNSIH